MSEAAGPADYGRVDSDGTVYVRTADGERAVGQVPDASPEEALSFFVRRYEALELEVSLLERRITSGALGPDDVHELTDGVQVSLAGIDFRVDHAPGHTKGSVLFRSPYAADDDVAEVVFSGDVLFAGSIGRTDLPGGNPADMLESLRTKVATLPDSAVVLPGHGPQTTIAQERATNPYLQPGYLVSGDRSSL